MHAQAQLNCEQCRLPATCDAGVMHALTHLRQWRRAWLQAWLWSRQRALPPEFSWPQTELESSCPGTECCCLHHVQVPYWQVFWLLQQVWGLSWPSFWVALSAEQDRRAQSGFSLCMCSCSCCDCRMLRMCHASVRDTPCMRLYHYWLRITDRAGLVQGTSHAKSITLSFCTTDLQMLVHAHALPR